MITISGVEVDVISGSLSIDDAIGERSTASFTVKTALGVSYNQGMPVEITDTDLIFAGVIDTVTEKKLKGTDYLLHDISCKDWHYLADKRTLGKVYTGTTYSLTNLVTNPSFEDTAFWATNAGITYSTTHKLYGTRALKTTSATANNVVDNLIDVTQNHIYYVANHCKVVSNPNANTLVGEIRGWGTLTFFGNICKRTAGAEDWTRYSLRFLYNQPNEQITFRMGCWGASSLEAYYDGFMVIDLTDIFGAGNEPTKAWCDENIVYGDTSLFVPITTGDIASDIITTKLTSEGITVGTISDGVAIDEAVFNYDYVSKCIDTLAEKSGYIWYIDFDKKLYFIPRETFSAPWTVTEADVLDISVERGNPEYRNRQVIRGAVGLTSSQTETFKGDGETTTFVVGYPIAVAPTISVGGVAKTVGIRGIDTGKDWYWAKGEKEITGDTKLTSSDTLSVIYQGEYPLVVISSDGAEISARATVESNSGINEDVINEDNIPEDAAFDLAAKKLKKFGTISKRVSFTTMTAGLEAGQIVEIEFPSHDINQEMLIESVSISESAGYFYYDVVAIDGAVMGSWTNLFKNIVDRSQPTSIFQNVSESESITTVVPFTKTWTEVEHPNIFKDLQPSDTLYPSATLYPCFDDENKVKYISFSYDGTELFRKAITSQTIGATEIVSVSYISADELNFPVDKVAWYGGVSATSDLGTGIKVDEQTYIKTKTSKETLQITKTDTRWA